MLLRRLYLDFLSHDSVSAELELELELDLEVDLGLDPELLAVLGLLSSLLLPSARQSYALSGGAGCGRCFLHLLLNAGQSDPLSRGAGCGRFLFPRQELHAGEIVISYLSA